MRAGGVLRSSSWGWRGERGAVGIAELRPPAQGVWRALRALLVYTINNVLFWNGSAATFLAFAAAGRGLEGREQVQQQHGKVLNNRPQRRQ